MRQCYFAAILLIIIAPKTKTLKVIKINSNAGAPSIQVDALPAYYFSDEVTHQTLSDRILISDNGWSAYIYPNDALQVDGVNFAGDLAGLSAKLAPVFSRSAPAAAGANQISAEFIKTTESVNGVYVPVLKAAGLSSSSGLADHASGGVVAAAAGATGSGSLFLPRPIDPSKPWRCAVLIEINDNQPITNLQFTDAFGDWWTGARITAASSLLITGDWGGGVSFMNAYGYTGGIPAGTKIWFGLISDGVNVFLNIIPDSPSGFTASNPSFRDPYSNKMYCFPRAANDVYNSNNVFGGNGNQYPFRLCQFAISTNSVNNRIIGLYWSQSINAPMDGVLNPPFVMRPNILQDITAWVLCPARKQGGYIDICMTPHANGSNEFANTDTNAELSKLYQNGFIMCGILGSVNANGLTDATASNWGAPAGMRYRKALIEWIRANVPLTRYLFAVGQSMGALNAIAFQAQYPAIVRAAYLISPAIDLEDSYSNRGFSAIIQKAFGAWFVCIQAGTAQNPASATAYWRRISYGNGAPDDTYYLPPYVWRDAYSAGASYSVNDIVCIPSTMTAAEIKYANPVNYPYALKSLPVKIKHGDSDAVIPAAQSNSFVAAITAAGGSASVEIVPGASHLSAGLYNGDDIVSFFNQYQ